MQPSKHPSSPVPQPEWSQDSGQLLATGGVKHTSLQTNEGNTFLKVPLNESRRREAPSKRSLGGAVMESVPSPLGFLSISLPTPLFEGGGGSSPQVELETRVYKKGAFVPAHRSLPETKLTPPVPR